MAILENRIGNTELIAQMTETGFLEEEDENQELLQSSSKAKGSNVGVISTGKSELHNGNSISGNSVVGTTTSSSKVNGMKQVQNGVGNVSGASGGVKNKLMNAKIELADDNNSGVKESGKNISKYKANLDRKLGDVSAGDGGVSVDIMFNKFNIMGDMTKPLLPPHVTSKYLDTLNDLTVGMHKMVFGTGFGLPCDNLLDGILDNFLDKLSFKGISIGIKADLLGNIDFNAGCTDFGNLLEDIKDTSSDFIKSLSIEGVLTLGLGKASASLTIGKIIDDNDGDRSQLLTAVNGVLGSNDTSKTRDKLLMINSVASVEGTIEEDEVDVSVDDALRFSIMKDNVVNIINNDDTPQTNSGVSDYNIFSASLKVTNSDWGSQDKNGRHDYSAIRNSRKMNSLANTKVMSKSPDNRTHDPEFAISINVSISPAEAISITTNTKLQTTVDAGRKHRLNDDNKTFNKSESGLTISANERAALTKKIQDLNKQKTDDMSNIVARFNMFSNEYYHKFYG